MQVGNQVALAIENALAYEKVAEARNQLNTEKTYLEDEIRYDHNLEDIVGKSRALRETLSKAEVVAKTDATVLLMGETGTGKELIATIDSQPEFAPGSYVCEVELRGGSLRPHGE